MDIKYWIQETAKRGFTALAIAIIGAFLFTNSAKTILRGILAGWVFSPSHLLSSWLNSAVAMVQGSGIISLAAVGVVAAIAAASSYTAHNLRSKNFDASIGIWIALAGFVAVFVVSPEIPSFIPVQFVFVVPLILGLLFAIWQSK